MSKEKPGYYAVVPANVRYDEKLRPNAKLLYAEITALCSATGACTARNDYFARLYGLSRKTVSELIRQIAERGYIEIKVQRGENKQVLRREIFLTEAVDPEKRESASEGPETSPKAPEDLAAETGEPSPGKRGTPSPEKSGDLPRKMWGPPPKNRGTSPENPGDLPRKIGKI